MSRALDRVLSALDRTDHTARQSGCVWTARCPAHEDRKPSLSIAVGRKGVLIHCHAGCSTQSILSALGLTWQDLFDARAVRRWVR